MNEIIQLVPAETSPIPEIYRWGIEVIRVIQRIENPFLTALMKFITELGTEKFYVPLILVIFWWIDEKRGFRLGVLIIVSAWLNAFMKDVLKQPRPFILEPSLGLAYESTYGAPSGHAQMSLCFWLPIAAWCAQVWAAKSRSGKVRTQKQLLIWASAVLIILLMGFTRLYLGVHFPTDLFAGWLLAGVILALMFFCGSFLKECFAFIGLRGQNIFAAVIALAMNGIFPGNGTLPALFLGFCTGYNLMKQRFPFFAGAEINGKNPGVGVKLLRCFTGFAGMVIIFLAARLIFPGEGSLFGNLPFWSKASPFYDIGHFIRYGFLGFWASAGAPRMFQRMGLASIPGGGE
ncbi:MAG: phosphatase PAP2 family protein [Treponema sp.]|jgi:membrane-associated phospholipid phosphatase|nr:phosphatase PAP2 family protein [Treponema sp.]